MSHDTKQTLEAAITAYESGYIPVPLLADTKKSMLSGWRKLSFESKDDVAERFQGWFEQGWTNLGVLLGEPSGGLLDVDLDHPLTRRFKDMFLPPTAAKSGRDGSPSSHFWYRAEGIVPSTRQHKMPDNSTMIVELRSDGAQTAIAPSRHPNGELYRWEESAWGGDIGPAVVDGQVLTVQVALIGLSTVLAEYWPTQGSRHETYLALAGGLLRYGSDVHPYWERNAPVIIGALAEGTLDEDGADSRVSEAMGTTIRALREGKKATGFNRLSELLGTDDKGNDVVSKVRQLVSEVEAAAGFDSRQATVLHDGGQAPAQTVGTIAGPATSGPSERVRELLEERERRLASEAEEELAEGAEDAPEERDPLDDRLGSWDVIDIEPYFDGKAQKPIPSVLVREDGQALMYPGRVNMLFGSSESAKSWIALYTCLQEIRAGNRVLYIDLEDEPANTINRIRELGAGRDDVVRSFGYLRPEEPLGPMQRNRYGDSTTSSQGRLNAELLEHALLRRDPTLIVVDGMTVLYGLHGLDTNDATATDVITTWLKQLTANGRRTVLLIDHSVKNAEKGSLPLGSQHKVSMVQGALLQAWPLVQPVPGAVGDIELVVMKDRPGEVRRVSLDATTGTKAQIAARIKMDSTEPDVVNMTIEAPVDPVEAARESGIFEIPLDEQHEYSRGGHSSRRYNARSGPRKSSASKDTEKALKDAQRRAERHGAVLGVLSYKHPRTGPQIQDALESAGLDMSQPMRSRVLADLVAEGKVAKTGERRHAAWTLIRPEDRAQDVGPGE